MKSIFVLLIILGCINAVNGIQCYACNSGKRNACADPFDGNWTTAAEKVSLGSTAACLKTKTTKKDGVEIVRNGIQDTIRCFGGKNGCMKHEDDCESIEICCCTTDLCNGASMSRQQPLAIFFLTMTPLVIFIHRRYTRWILSP